MAPAMMSSRHFLRLAANESPLLGRRLYLCGLPRWYAARKLPRAVSTALQRRQAQSRVPLQPQQAVPFQR